MNKEDKKKFRRYSLIMGWMAVIGIFFLISISLVTKDISIINYTGFFIPLLIPMLININIEENEMGGHPFGWTGM